MISRGRLISGVLLAAALTMVLGGCGAAEQRRADRMQSAYLRHDMDTAARLASRQLPDDEAEARARGSNLRWALEAGMLWRLAGDFEASERAFAMADELVAAFDDAPVVRLAQQGRATMTNLATLPYDGYAYDRIMLSTYRALNAMAMGDMETARVELNRVHMRQQEAVERNRRRIEAAEADAREQAQQRPAPVRNGNLTEARAGRIERQLGEFDIPFAELYQAQGDYINPFAEFLQGIYFLHAGRASGDVEQARHALQRVAAVVGERNEHVAADLALAQTLADGQTVEAPLTYVIFETGRAPSRREERIDVPVPIRGVHYLGAAFPALRFHDNFEPHLIINHAGGRTRTHLLASMDTIIGLEFRQQLPAVILRTLTATAAQAAAQYGVQRAAGDGAAGFAVTVGGILYRMMQVRADLRSWVTLPKQFHYARLETPADRTLHLRTPTGVGRTVKIEPGHVTVVHVRSIRRSGELLVWQYRLR